MRGAIPPLPHIIILHGAKLRAGYAFVDVVLGQAHGSVDGYAEISNE
jgi:hypothetical protein